MTSGPHNLHPDPRSVTLCAAITVARHAATELSTPRERAALALVEATTSPADAAAQEDAYQRAGRSGPRAPPVR